MKDDKLDINDITLAPNDLARACLDMIIYGLTKDEEVVDNKEDAYDIVCDLITEIIYEIKRRIKRACEFYLRYKDKPQLLKEENIKCEYSKKIVEISQLPSGEWIIFFEDGDFMGYNEWLFRMAFKDVFEEDVFEDNEKGDE